MNKIFKVVKNHAGNQVVASELAKGAKKGSKLTAMTLAALFSSSVFAVPVSIQGSATSENAVAVGTDSIATSVNGVANGKGSVATGQGFTRDAFNTKKQENQAALDAVNAKKQELNNKQNQLNAANDAITSLGHQIEELAHQQDVIADKIERKKQLATEKEQANNAFNEANNAFETAKNALSGIQTGDKNLYLNFTDVLQGLNWAPYNGTDESRNTVANELKTKIETHFADFAGRYTDKQYQDIVQGFINRQAQYQGSYEGFAEATINTGAVLSANQLYNIGFFNKSLDETGYDDVIRKFENGLTYSEILKKAQQVDKDATLIFEGNHAFSNMFSGSILDNGNILEHNYQRRYNTGIKFYLNKQGQFINWNDGLNLQKYNNLYDNIDNNFAKYYDQRTLNAIILESESSKKLQKEQKFDPFYGYNSYDKQGVLVDFISYRKDALDDTDLSNGNKIKLNFIPEYLNLDKDFIELYNTSVIKNHSAEARTLIALKAINGKKLAPMYNDENIHIISRLKDFTVSNQNLIRTEDITKFKDFFEVVKSYEKAIDWNFQESAIDLVAYRSSLDKVLAYNTKIDNILNLYQSIINERKKDDADLNKIAEETKQLMQLKEEVLDGTKDITNFFAGIEPQYNRQWLDYYRNYGKAEADAKIARINNELKLYNDKDEIVVAATDKAKEIQANYDKTKETLDEKKAALDEIEKTIADLELTASENAVDDVKNQKEQEKADREAEKQRLEEEIRANNEELTRLEKELANTSLRDLGLNSQAYGSQAFASGDNAIAIGTNSTVTSEDGIAIGQNTNVTGIRSIAIGKGSKVSGEDSIAIGVGHNVSGNHSTTIGDPNVVSGNNSFVAGNNNNVASDNVMVMGNNVTVAAGFNNAVVLGAGSSVANAVPTSSHTIRNTTYNFAGINPTSVVSIGAVGAERQLINVAAGRLSDSSTDAINGSQLYAVVEAVNNLQASTISPTDVSDAVDEAISNKLVGGNNVNIEETVNPDDGSKTFTIHALIPKPNKTTITTGTGLAVTETETGDERTGKTINYHITSTGNANNPQATTEESVSSGTNIVVKQDGVNESGGKNYVVNLSNNIDLTKDGSLTIGDVSISNNRVDMGGNVISNISNPVNDNDAANKLYVDNTRTTVGSKDATVTITSTTNDKGSVHYDLAVNGGFGSTTDDGKVISKKLGETITITGDGKNVSTTTTDDGHVRIGLKDDITFNSITIGDIVISDNGINAGNKKISNVTDGNISANSKEAVNGSQLHALGNQIINHFNQLGSQFGDKINQLDQSVNYAHQRIDHVNRRMDKMNKQRKAGNASTLAVAGLPQAHREGQSGLVAGVGQYQGETGLAIGYTRISDNGKWAIRASATTNTRKEVGGQLGVGYFW